MYRIVRESYRNYMADFMPHNTDSSRYKVMLPLRLAFDPALYEAEKNKKSLDYQKFEDFIYRVNHNIEEYPSMKSFLWSLKSRGIYGVDYKVISDGEFREQIKTVNMFLKLAYWQRKNEEGQI